jgi:hypothetical protein
METKVCNKCNIDKGVTEFYSGRRRCKLCYNKHKKKPTPEQREEYNKRRREQYYENHDEEKERSRLWKKNNPDKVTEYNSMYKGIYHKNRMENDPIYRVKHTVRNLINCSIYHKGFTKNSRTFDILGCSYEDFKCHIESNWEGWMSWDNYGLYNGDENYGWDLDHIVPVSSAQCEEDIIRLNHYSNIQPLCSYVNRNVKRDNIDWES